MAGKITDSIFVTGAKDELMAVDVYSVKDSYVKNNIVDSAIDFSKGAFDSIRNAPGLVRDLSGVVKLDGGKVGLDSAALKDRLLNLSSGVRGPLSQLSDGAVGGMVSGLETMGLNPNTSLGILASVQNASSSLDIENLKDARGITGLLESITGDPEVAKLFDLEAESALFGGILSEAIRLGVPDAIDILLEKVASDKVAKRFLEDNLLAAITYCDLAVVRKIFNKIGRVGVLTQVPDAVEMILTFYIFKGQGQALNYPALKTELVTLLNDIDPNWFTYNRNGTTITKLAPFSYVSDDAITLLLGDELYRTEIMIASEYPSNSLLDLAKRDYPLLLLD